MLLAGQMTAAETQLDQLRNMFPDRLYIEINAPSRRRGQSERNAH